MKRTLEMDRLRKITALLLMIAVMLTACGTQGNQENVPATEPAIPNNTNALVPSPEATMGPTASPEDLPGIPVTGDLNPARLSNLLRFDVRNQVGEQIGQVHNMVMDLDTSTIVYVVVSTGGFLSVGERQIAVPWSALQIKSGPDASASAPSFFMLLVDQKFFMNAPAIKLDQDLPKIGQPAKNWDQDIRSYWKIPLDAISTPTTAGQPSGTSQTPTPEGVPLKGILLASDALGFNFKLQGQENLDVSIDDVIVNIQTGKILYVVIHTNFENARDQWVPIPYSLLNLDLPDRAYILNVDTVTLQSAPFYIDSLYPNTSRPGWDDTYVYFWKQHGLTARP